MRIVGCNTATSVPGAGFRANAIAIPLSDHIPMWITLSPSCRRVWAQPLWNLHSIRSYLADGSHTSYLTYMCLHVQRWPALSLTTSHLAFLLLLLSLSLSLFVAALLLLVIFAVGHDMLSRLCVDPLSAAAIASVITKQIGSHLKRKQW